MGGSGAVTGCGTASRPGSPCAPAGSGSSGSGSGSGVVTVTVNADTTFCSTCETADGAKLRIRR
ncbi:hypothetical protein BA950_12535 [Erythrobacter sp. SAORIC-644]|nr:hypothetical protein BA950_12535 [Erythrobacter sp. SAORIC-644]